MLTPRTSDTEHRVWLLRLLTAIVDDRLLASVLHFKGGTCAAMRDLLDRFSVDLDFDLAQTENIPDVRMHLEAIFSKLGLHHQRYQSSRTAVFSSLSHCVR
jgi:predicted nucleotidyltransferase component of viral defense system